MILVMEVQQEEVMDHWKRWESTSDECVYWRWIITSSLPDNTKWYLAEIEEKDIGKIFLISSDDWREITRTFTLVDAVTSLCGGVDDSKIDRILKMKRIYQKNLDGLDRKLILVSPSIEGSFTIIEGNKRSVALQSLGKLASSRIYLGISGKMTSYYWARFSMRRS